MKKIVAFEQSSVIELQRLASSDPLETCASGLVSPAGTHNGVPRYVVREFLPVPASAYQSRSSVSAVLSPAYCIELANRARKAGLGIAIAHTHPGDHAMQSFSSIDDAGEDCLKDYFERRLPNSCHIAALFTKNTGSCRQLGSKKLSDMQVVGSDVYWLNSDHAQNEETHIRFDRQVLAFGSEGQKILGNLRVAIVGAGGTGSFIATELAYLGLSNFTLIDPDKIDETNLNRLLGSKSSDIGKFKVEQMSSWIKLINPQALCEAHIADIVDDKTAKYLSNVDFIFLCTDSHASRAVVNQFAYQYLIPTIDMGVAIHTTNGLLQHIVGRAQMISSGLPCLVCSGWIDPNQVRIEMMSPQARARDPYFKGDGVSQPAVISLNGTVSSFAITMFLSAVTSIPSQARLILYDAIRGSVRPSIMTPDSKCIVCSSDGSLARGEKWTLPTRQNVSD